MSRRPGLAACLQKPVSPATLLCMGSFLDLSCINGGKPGARPALAAALLGFGLVLAACADVEIDWTRTGQLWLGALCDGASSCTYDADGDPMTRW